MTEKDTQAVQRLRTMLEEGSQATLLDISGVIKELSSEGTTGASTKVVTPMEVLDRYVAVQSGVWGISRQSFLELNNKVSETAFHDYFQCIDALPDLGVAYGVMLRKVWGMGTKGHEGALAAFAKQIPSFLTSEGKWNGSHCIFLALRSAVECVSSQETVQNDVVLSFVRARTGLEGTVAAIAVMFLVIRGLSGDLDDDNESINRVEYPARQARKRHLLDIFNTLKAENAECLKKVSFSWVAPLLFGLDMERDWTETKVCRDTGLPADGGICSYAEAIIVACAGSMALSRDECIKAVTLSLLFEDRSHAWRQDAFRTVSLFMSDLVARFDDAMEIWKSVHKHVRHLIYRGLHEYRTASSISLAARLEILIGFEYHLVRDLHEKGSGKDAMEVWSAAWNECVTALYAWPSALGFISLAQYLFVTAGLFFSNEAEGVPSGAELLKQLPCVETLTRERIDSATVCLEALKDNLDESAKARICSKDLGLARLIESISSYQP